MRLEQMRAIAVPLGLELPPLGGAGGAWAMFINGPSSALGPGETGEGFFNEAPPAGVENFAAGRQVTTQLLSVVPKIDPGPTKMQLWHIYNLRIPVNVEASTEAAVEEKGVKIVAFAALIVRIGGDVVYNTSAEQTMNGPETIAAGVVGGYATQFYFAADLNNPLPLQCGRTLTLEVTVSFNKILHDAGVGKHSEIRVAIAKRRPVPAVAEQLEQGTISYTVQELSGHRVLS